MCSLIENIQLLDTVSPKHRNLTEGSSGLGFCARKNMHLNILKRCKEIIAIELQRWVLCTLKVNVAAIINVHAPFFFRG